MAKPRLEKVEALFYVLKQVAKGGCIRILIHPPYYIGMFGTCCSEILSAGSLERVPYLSSLGRMVI